MSIDFIITSISISPILNRSGINTSPCETASSTFPDVADSIWSFDYQLLVPPDYFIQIFLNISQFYGCGILGIIQLKKWFLPFLSKIYLAVSRNCRFWIQIDIDSHYHKTLFCFFSSFFNVLDKLSNLSWIFLQKSFPLP